MKEPVGENPGARCMECPKHDAQGAWCPIRAERRPGRAPACQYGLGLIVKNRRRKQHDRND